MGGPEAVAAEQRLALRVLGELELARGEERLLLPPSKKTRALLAYLAMTGKPQRRERLCSLFWEIPDDPRAALRWSLSKLRSLVDDDDGPRIIADRESVALDRAGLDIDLVQVRARAAEGVDRLSTEALAELASAFRGDFLEGIAFPNLHDVQSWLVAEREDTRRLHAAVLRALVERLAEDPEHALPPARLLIQIDPFDEKARATLIRLLASAGRAAEAEQQYDAGRQLLRELGATSTGVLDLAWRSARAGAPVQESPLAPSQAPPAIPSDDPFPSSAPATVGREVERARLAAVLQSVATRRQARVLLVSGEPGVGKTHLLRELIAAVRDRHGTVLDGCAYEIESNRPYGPWIDALRQLPAAALGPSVSADLAPLLPEYGEAAGGEHSRERLYGAVVELIAARAHSAAPVLLLLDDVHWLDQASAEVLHYTVRMSRHRPLLVALAARDGELPDNSSMLTVLRSLRRDGLVEEISLGPLSAAETASMLRAVAPEIDAGQVFARSAGNPLFALEIARARSGDPPRSLNGIIRDRIDRLPARAGEVLRWAAVLGPTFTLDRLRDLVDPGFEELTAALETLERQSLLRETRPAGTEAGYAFAHEIVRDAVYADLSEPRRRLMHRRVAEAFVRRDDPTGEIAGDIAHHASLAGDTAMAARACVSAGRRCLRVFANAEAESLARRGLRYAEALDTAERIRLTLDLIDVSIAARRPDKPEEMAGAIERLAEQALDHGFHEHARLGFHMLSYLRWERGDWSAARKQMLRAEMVSRSADEKAQVVAMAEAARCLAMLERDLPQAEALLLEAGALSSRVGHQPAAIPDAMGMISLYQGELDRAARLFTDARTMARRDGDRSSEFQTLEHLVTLELQRGDYEASRRLCEEMIVIAERLRTGSEVPFARCLLALARYLAGEDEAASELNPSIEALRLVDAKHRLAFVLNRVALYETSSGHHSRARERAAEALTLAMLLEHLSEIALALATLARCAAAAGDNRELSKHLDALRAQPLHAASAQARDVAEAALQDLATR